MDYASKMFLTIALLISTWGGGVALIAYDCGAPAMNITTLSLLEIEECDIPIHEPEITPTNIKLLQQVEFSHIKVRQCKIEIRRKIKYCGMNSHTSEVKHGEIEFIQEVPPEECHKIHLTRSYQAYHTLFSNLVMNSSNARPVTMAGSISSDSSCKGTSYSDPYGTWDNVIVTGYIYINIFEYEATVNLNQNEIILRSGSRCKHDAGTCIDWEGGNTHWEPLPEERCKFNNYEIVYEGRAEKIRDTKNGANGEEIFSITSSEVTFALAVKGKTSVCGYNLLRTEHPKLFISEIISGDSFPSRQISLTNMDIFAYVNAKLIYVVKDIGNQITNLYNNVMKQECEIEKRVLRNTLGFASFAPAEFAYHYMNKPGYIAHVAGEVIRLAKCVPVNVVTRKTKECFQELPVSRGNQTLFMMPRTRIITETGHQIECNSFLAPMYHINNNWYQSLPQLAQAAAPDQIPAITKPTWKFITPAHLADSGIYSPQDLENLRSSIMFPVERTAVLNTIARGATGEDTVDQGITISHWVNEEVIQESVQKIWNKMHSFFNTVGTFSTTLLGVWVTIKSIKFVIDTLVHGYALHSIYGWSIWLVGSIWDSVTSLLLHLSSRAKPTADNLPTQGQDTNNPQALPLQVIRQQAPNPGNTDKLSDLPSQMISQPSTSTTGNVESERLYPPLPLPREEANSQPVWQPRNYPVGKDNV